MCLCDIQVSNLIKSQIIVNIYANIIYAIHVHLRELLCKIHQVGGISAACWFCYFESTSSAGHLKRSIVPRLSGRQDRVVSSFTDICLSQWCFPPSRNRQEGKPPEIQIIRNAIFEIDQRIFSPNIIIHLEIWDQIR